MASGVLVIAEIITFLTLSLGILVVRKLSELGTSNLQSGSDLEMMGRSLEARKWNILFRMIIIGTFSGLMIVEYQLPNTTIESWYDILFVMTLFVTVVVFCAPYVMYSFFDVTRYMRMMNVRKLKIDKMQHDLDDLAKSYEEL